MPDEDKSFGGSLVLELGAKSDKSLYLPTLMP